MGKKAKPKVASWKVWRGEKADELAALAIALAHCLARKTAKLNCKTLLLAAGLLTATRA